MFRSLTVKKPFKRFLHRSRSVNDYLKTDSVILKVNNGFV